MQHLPEDHVGENLFEVYYEPYKRQIWTVLVLFLVVSIGSLTWRHIRQSRIDERWNRYYEVLHGESGAGAVPRLRQLVADYPDSDVTPWAMAALASSQQSADEFDAAAETLAELKSRFPEFHVNRVSSTGTAAGVPLADALVETLRGEAEWAAENRYEHRWPAEDRLALIETTAGNLWIGFYGDDAPKHVESFVSKAKAGDYNGTQAYHIRSSRDGAPEIVTAGSRASKTEIDPGEHDRNEPLHTMPPEDARYSIKHLRRVVTTVDMPSGHSDQRFAIVVAPEWARFDGANTPFAAVMDKEQSIETLDRIGKALTYFDNPKTAKSNDIFSMRDHPYPAIRIRRVSIWKDERLEDGHAWDTSRAGTSDPEPWEASLPADFVPQDIADDEGGDDSAGGDEEDAGDERNNPDDE